MRRLWVIPLLAIRLNVSAGENLRIEQQISTMDDTAAHTIEQLGKPVYQKPVQHEDGAFPGERWQ